MKNRLFHTLLAIIALLTQTACTIGRYVEPDQHVLHQVALDVKMADDSPVTADVKEALKNATNYYKQKPNTKFLGIKWAPVGKWMYCFMTDTTSNLWNNYWHNIGQAPVIYSEGLAARTADQLKQLLDAKGCFSSKVTFDTLGIDGHNIAIAYHVRATRRRVVDEVVYRTADPAVQALLRTWRDDSPLQAGMPYDQEKISAERSRIVSNLREAGYYHASPDRVTFLVDTTYSDNRLSIDVLVDSRGLKVYHINNIFIYPNSTAGLRSGESVFDTLIQSTPGRRSSIDYQFIYDKPMTLSPKTISRTMMLFPGMTYRPRYITNTYNSLLSLRNFKYINIEFTESPASSDTLPLVDAHVRLIRSNQQRVSLSVELTNASPLSLQDSGNFVSGGNLGVETAIEYQHKNLFGGAELFKIKGSLLIELPKFIFKNGSTGFHDSFSSFEAGLDATLDMPQFLLPFTSGIVWQRIKPHTLITLGGSYQYHYYFERVLASTSFGYSWSQKRTTHQHQLLPLEFTYVRILNLDDDFANRIINDLRLKYQYSSHFILDARYDYAYSNQKYGTRDNFTHVHASFETAGNVLAGISRLAGSPTDTNGIRHIFGVPFSQYIRAQGEVSRYIYHGSRSSFVVRAMLGLGIPFGNSSAMPYEKCFFGGGPTTMRAWQLRHLGPGSYNSNGDILERVGDLQLVVNLEERFPIASIFEGAVFADFGNVWLLNPSEQYPGGNIDLGTLPSEIAAGIGLGLRLNVNIATIRVDFALPLYDPGYDAGMRFRPPHWTFRQIVTNFGIGYPF